MRDIDFILSRQSSYGFQFSPNFSVRQTSETKILGRLAVRSLSRSTFLFIKSRIAIRLTSRTFVPFSEKFDIHFARVT